MDSLHHKNRRFSKLAIVTICCLFIDGLYNSAVAAEPGYIQAENPAPESAADIENPLDASFEEVLDPIGFFSGLKEYLKDQPAFFRDTKLDMNVRTYDFRRDNDGFIDDDGSNNNKAWALGGSINYESGMLLDRVNVGGSYFTSQRVTGKRNETGTGLLEPVQNGFDVLGEAYVNYTFHEALQFRGYRQSLALPYLNRQDTRMLPITHEAYMLRGFDYIPQVDFIGGYVSKIKLQNQDSFKPISRATGADDTDEGLVMAGARYRFNENTDIGAINYYSFDVLNIFYSEANYLTFLTEDIPVSLSAQFTDQRSVGSEAIGSFDTRTAGISASTSYKGFVLTLAGTKTDDNDGIRSPYGGRPSYISLMLEDFDRADEEAWLVGLSYDFSNIGLDGLSAFMNYAEGNTPDSGVNASPDQTEFDITVDYRPPFIPFDGLWIRYRYANLQRDGDGLDRTNNRFIINLDIPLL